MSMTSLQDYVVSRLPEPVIAEERLSTFFAQADVADCMAQIEQLTGQIVARWQQEPETNAFTALTPAEQEQSPLEAVEKSAKVAGDQPVRPDLVPEAKVAAESEQSPTEPEPLVPESIGSDTESVTILQTSLPEIMSGGQPVVDVAPPAPQTPADPVRFLSDTPPAPQPLRSLSIPNGTVGKPYSYVFDFGALGIPELTKHTLSLDADLGLTYDPTTQFLSGTPAASGEFSFDLTYRLRTDEPNRPALTRKVQLLVNPDPRSLWKDLPSDTSDPYYKPDSDQVILAMGDVRLLAASVRGRSHAHEGKFRDDDFSLTYLAETGWYLLSVADGAGSANYSRKGAQLACETVTAHLQSQIEPQSWSTLTDIVDQYAASPPETQTTMVGTVQRHLYDVLGKAVFAAYKAIEAEAQTKAAEPKDFATTLITVLARPVATGWFVGAFWVGDGGVGIYQTDRDPIILGTPDGGEYAGQTRFLTMSETISSNFFGRFRFAVVEDFTAIILMTDGITDPKFQTDSNLVRKEKWDELWADLNRSVTFADDAEAPAQLQDWLTFWSPGNHDDRTIALLYAHAGNAKT